MELVQALVLLAFSAVVIVILARGLGLHRRRAQRAIRDRKALRGRHIELLRIFSDATLEYERAIGQCRQWLTDEGLETEADQIVVHIGKMFQYRTEIDRLRKQVEALDGRERD